MDFDLVSYPRTWKLAQRISAGPKARQGSLGVEGVAGSVFLSEANTQGLQKGQVATGERAICSFVVSLCCGCICFNFIQADRGLKHQEDIETLLADVFDDTCNVLRL